MPNEKNQKEKQNTGNSQKNVGKNETLNDAGADVVDYGRSEQKAIEKSERDTAKNTSAGNKERGTR